MRSEEFDLTPDLNACQAMAEELEEKARLRSRPCRPAMASCPPSTRRRWKS